MPPRPPIRNLYRVRVVLAVELSCILVYCSGYFGFWKNGTEELVYIAFKVHKHKLSPKSAPRKKSCDPAALPYIYIESQPSVIPAPQRSPCCNKSLFFAAAR